MLSREIATSLRGRSLSTEILPFSFAESLRHEGVELPERWPPGTKLRSLLEHRLSGYLENGGFPEVQGIAQDLRVRVLQEYVDVVVFRDVVERHGVDNLPAFRYLERKLLASPAGKFSVNKLFNGLKSQGMRVGKDSLYEYLAYLEPRWQRTRRSPPKPAPPNKLQHRTGVQPWRTSSLSLEPA